MSELTTAEMRARLETFRAGLGDAEVGTCHMYCYDMYWLFDLAAAELERRERVCKLGNHIDRLRLEGKEQNEASL